MESSNLVKVAAAFLIGVVVALGSALIYVRMNEVPDKAVAAAPVTPDLPAIPETPATSRNEPDVAAASQADAPAVHPEEKPLPTVKAKAKPKVIHPAKQQTREPITVIAQNNPPPANIPLASPVKMPDPAVREPSPLPLPSSPATQPEFPTPVAPQPHVVTLQAGTNVAIRLGETLASDHNYSGDTFRATLQSPIIVDGFIIADRGSKVLGRVTNVQAAGRVQGVSELTLALTEINTTDGQRVRVQTDFLTSKGHQSTGSDAAKIAGGAALGAIIGAIAGGGKGAAIGAGAGGAAGTGVVLATRGKPTVLTTETQLTFRLSAPVTITEQFNN